MLEDLMEKVEKYNPTSDFSFIIKAYEFALNAHLGQKRVSGEEYISHPAAVAEILADLNMDNKQL